MSDRTFVSLSRRRFLAGSAWAGAGFAFGGLSTASAAPLTSQQRVDRALAGLDVDRPPISLWNHFGLEKQGPQRHAEATVAFHRAYQTDLVKVMSDFPYPKPAGAWFDLREEASPFPAQLRALEYIRGDLAGTAPFVETIFNPWNVAENLSSPQEVQRLKAEQPQRLLDALQVIARSEANHARLAVKAGAAGVFLAVANAQKGILTPEEYARFSEPFDRLVLEAVKSAPLNVLHVHGDAVYLDRFYTGWPASAINYSAHSTGVGIDAVRARYAGVIIGGIDETNYRTLTPAAVQAQAAAARQHAGARFVLAPGCSVPNDATPAELRRLRGIFPSGNER